MKHTGAATAARKRRDKGCATNVATGYRSGHRFSPSTPLISTEQPLRCSLQEAQKIRDRLPEQVLCHGPALQPRGHGGERQINTAPVCPCAITLSSHVGAKEASGRRGCVFVAKTKSLSPTLLPSLPVAALLLPMGINAGSSLHRQRLSR